MQLILKSWCLNLSCHWQFILSYVRWRFNLKKTSCKHRRPLWKIERFYSRCHTEVFLAFYFLLYTQDIWVWLNIFVDYANDSTLLFVILFSDYRSLIFESLNTYIAKVGSCHDLLVGGGGIKINAGKMLSMIVSISRTLNPFLPNPLLTICFWILATYYIYQAFCLTANYTFEWY